MSDSRKIDKPIILCVDDRAAQLERREILEGEGFAVLNATTGYEALRIMSEEPVCLVLSDHMLSGTTGAELAAELKAIKRNVPVVLYSGAPPASLQHVDCFINKGEPVKDFLALVHDLVRRYRSR